MTDQKTQSHAFARSSSSAGLCGFNQVRVNEDGEYFCTVCGINMGKDFRIMVEALLGKRWTNRLDEQCSGP